MGGSSSSSSKGDQLTDNSVNLNNGGFVTQGGGNISVTQTDHGAVEKAFGFAQQNSKAAMDLAKKNSEGAFELSEESVEAMQETAGNALDFGGETLEGAYDFGGEAIEVVETTASKTLDFADRQSRALAANSQGVVEMFKKFAENLKAGQTSEQTGTERLTLYIVIALMVLMAFFALKAKK